jgi:hypothetical protein
MPLNVSHALFRPESASCEVCRFDMRNARKPRRARRLPFDGGPIPGLAAFVNAKNRFPGARHRICLAVLELGLALLGKRRHAFLLVFQREHRMNTRRSNRSPSASGVSKARLTVSLVIRTAGSEKPAILSAALHRRLPSTFVICRNHARHQAGAFGFLGVHHPPGQAQVHRLGLADARAPAAACRPCRA